MMVRPNSLLAVAALGALLSVGCSESSTSPTLVAPNTRLASGGSGSGGGTSGGGGTGGGGSTNTVPQVAGTWTGAETYDPSLASFFPFGTTFAQSFTFVEDASGNLTGTDNVMHVAISGKASSNGSIVFQDGAYYGQKITVNVTGSTTCSDGSTGSVLSGKFQRKDGFGTISLNNCPTA